MPDAALPISAPWIEARILEVRGQRVLLDTDLARIFSVEPKRLIQQVKRNQDRFPPDFCWQLGSADLRNLRLQFATSSSSHGGRRHRPWVFNEHGALMAANVLRSPAAVLASVEVVRAFVRLRALIAEHRDLARRLDELEARYDLRFKAVFDAVRELLETSRRRRGRIGFGLDEPTVPARRPP